MLSSNLKKLKSYESELDKLKLKIKESNNVLEEYQEEIATYNERFDEVEDTINHLLEN